MEDEQSSDGSDAVLREELIAHIRDLGGFPKAADRRPELRMVQAEDELAGQDLPAG